MRAGPPILGVSIAALLMLGACGETPQTSDRSVRLSDNAAWAVSAEALPAYSAPGWKASGDRAAWEAQINARTTQGQNDYAAR